MMNYKSERHLVFVYGTLRNGFPNHYLLQSPSTKFIGKASSVERGILYAKGIPFLTFNKDVGIESTEIVGEIYEVNDNTLKNLDKLEGFVKAESYSNFYEREIKTFQLEENGIHLDCFVYLNDNELEQSAEIIHSGDYSDYFNKYYIK